jgi:quinol monooxygenase YgiN
MEGLEVTVRMRVRDGQLDGFRNQVERCVEETRAKDTKTLRYDWFLSRDSAEAETREAYVNSEGVIEHRMKTVAEATNELFRRFADDPVVTVYGPASPDLVELANARMGDAVRWYSFFQGLDS